MKANESFHVTKDSLGLIISNVKSKIAEKQLIEKKLTPFLFHKVIHNDLTKNIEGMTKTEQKKSLIEKGIHSEPMNPKKDNMNPKDIKISSRQILLQKYSNVEIKNKRNPRKRYHSALQTTRQQLKDINQTPKRPGTSTYEKISDKNGLELSTHQKSTRNQTVTRSNKAKSQKAYTVSKRTFSKKQTSCIKLKETENLDQRNHCQSFEETLREKKLKDQSQKQMLLKEQAFKNQRLQKLKQEFDQKFKNCELINFDFDGTIIDNINQQNDQPQHQNSIIFCKQSAEKVTKKLNSARSNHSTYRSLSNKRKQPNKKKIEIHETLLLVNTQFKVNANSYDEDRSVLDQLTWMFSQSKNSSYKTSLSRNTPQTNQTSQSLKNEKNASLKYFQSDEHLQNEQQFTNNYQRQTSTIPYLEIKQGICYKEELKVDEQKDGSLIQYASVSKQSSLCNKNSNKALNGRRTFRSYLSFKKTENKPVQSFNITFSAFTQRPKSVKSSRIQFNLKTPQQNFSRTQNTIKIFTDKNPFIEEDQDISNEKDQFKQAQTDLDKIRPKTTRVYFEQPSTKIPNQTLQNFKINKTQNILDYKAKVMMKQKLQRNLFEVEEIR